MSKLSKIIVISGNLGKTTFSYLLAQKLTKLSKDKKRVMIVSTDNYTPTAQYLMPIDKSHKSTIVDYIIVDTQTCLNKIDKIAINQCDLNICITTANYKGMAYRQNIKNDEVIQVIYNDSKYNPFEDVKQTYKHHVKYVMDYCKSLQYIYNGALLDDVVCPPKYDKLLKKIIDKEVNNDEQ